MVPSVDEIKQDYDWRSAFHEAACRAYRPEVDEGKIGPVAGVVEVIAAVPGENEGADWIGVFLMDDHRYWVVAAGCDYTGWGCQASGTVKQYQSVDAACSKLALGDEQRERLAEQLHWQQQRGRLRLDWTDDSAP